MSIPWTKKRPQLSSLTNRRYFRVDEVARYFGVSDRTIYRLIDMGDLKVVRLGVCIRISAEEIREFEAGRGTIFRKRPITFPWILVTSC